MMNKGIIAACIILGLGIADLAACSRSTLPAAFEVPGPPPEETDGQIAPKNDESDAESASDSKKTMHASDRQIQMKQADYAIDVHYPEFGIAAIDAALKQYAEEAVKSAQVHLKTLGKPDFDGVYEAGLLYDIVSASPDGVDILFKHTDYTGGAHGGLTLDAVMLDADGKRLDAWALLGTLFDNPDDALIKLSAAAREQLPEQLKDFEQSEAFYLSGTEPKRENFQNILRTDDGIQVFFDPYAVGPWAAGILSVKYRLK